MDHIFIHNQFFNTKNNSISPAQKAIKVIWTIGLSCFGIILFFYFKPTSVDNIIQIPGTGVIQNLNREVTHIDQLLVSSDESLMPDKKSFVNGALRFQWRNQQTGMNKSISTIILYDNILKRKLQKIPNDDNGEFSIKPVPR